MEVGVKKLNSNVEKALIRKFYVSPPSGLMDIYYPNTPGCTRGHHCIASSRPLVTLLNLNLNTKKHHPHENCRKFGLSPDPKDLNYYDPRWNRGHGNRNQLKPRRCATKIYNNNNKKTAPFRAVFPL